MSDNVFLIYQNEDILYSGYSIFDSGTELGPHKDPNIYREPYKRIQIPVRIPDKDKCYMIWKDKKVTWEEGVPQVFEVMDYIHEGYNFSDSPMEFLFVDIRKESQMEIK
jgi:aspartyl/asparaginyl beta-hydroxylase (cupin superfamily)